MKKIVRLKNKLLSGILMVLLGTAFLGCVSPVSINRDLFKIPQNEIQRISHEKIIVFGVVFGHQSSEVKKFGVQLSDKGTLNVSHGTSLLVYHEDINPASMAELIQIFKQHGFNSVEEFAGMYSSTEPIIPNSKYRAVPESIGRELFNFIKKNMQINKYANWRYGR